MDFIRKILKILFFNTEIKTSSEIKKQENINKPKIYGYVIGINKYSKEYYGDGIEDLLGCITDAFKFEKFLKSMNAEITMHLDNKATVQEFYIQMEYYASIMESGDILYLMESRHGTKIKDYSGDEKSGYDSAMCLYNGLVLDDEVRILLAQFKDGVEIINFNDACENGTVTRAMGKSTIRARGVNLPQVHFDAAKYRNKVKNSGKSKKIKASVLSISGADDFNYSMDLGKKGGNFTNEWFNSFEKLGVNSTYIEIFNDVKGNIKMQIPFIDTETNGYNKLKDKKFKR